MILLQHVCTEQARHTTLCLVDWCTQLTPGPHTDPALLLSLWPHRSLFQAPRHVSPLSCPFYSLLNCFLFFFLFFHLHFLFPPYAALLFCARIFWFAFLSFAISILLFFVYFIAMANPLQTAHINASLSSFYLLLLLLFLLSADH